MTLTERVAWFHGLLDRYAAWSAVAFPAGQQVVALCRPLVAVAGEVMAQLDATLPANQRLQRYLARALAGSLWEFDAGVYADMVFFPTN